MRAYEIVKEDNVIQFPGTAKPDEVEPEKPKKADKPKKKRVTPQEIEAGAVELTRLLDLDANLFQADALEEIAKNPKFPNLYYNGNNSWVDRVWDVFKKMHGVTPPRYLGADAKNKTLNTKQDIGPGEYTAEPKTLSDQMKYKMEILKQQLRTQKFSGDIHNSLTYVFADQGTLMHDILNDPEYQALVREEMKDPKNYFRNGNYAGEFDLQTKKRIPVIVFQDHTDEMIRLIVKLLKKYGHSYKIVDAKNLVSPYDTAGDALDSPWASLEADYVKKTDPDYEPPEDEHF